MLTPLTKDDPRQVGPYRLQSRIGSGGMGTVYLGFSESGSAAAVKVPSPALAGNPEFRGRFRTEVASASRVRGNSVAAVIDADVDSERPWMATEYVEGTSLADAVSRRGALDAQLLRALAVGLADALVAIHAAGIIHRDLKPSNILLAWDGPKVIDFGIARVSDSTSHTQTGVMIGTLAWMAPEQLRGENSLPATDVFAWGACVLFAAMGRPPFRGEASEVVAYQIMTAAPDLTALPPALVPVVRAALEKDPARRPTAAHLVAGLVGHDVRNAADSDEAAETVLAQNWSWSKTPPPTGADPAAAATRAAASAPMDQIGPTGPAYRQTPPPPTDGSPGWWPENTPPPRDNRRSNRLVYGLAAALIVIAGVVAVLLGTRHPGSTATGSSATLSPTGPVPTTTSPSVAPTSDTPTTTPTTPPPTTAPPTSAPPSVLTLTAARKMVRARGYVPTDDSAYDEAKPLNVIIGTAAGSADGYNKLAFFFAGGKYLGTDFKGPSAGITLVSSTGTMVTLQYALYKPADPLSTPSSSANVSWSWDGSTLHLLNDPPPLDQRR